MTLSDIRQWLRQELEWDREWFGTGKMDSTKRRAICLYHRKKGAANPIAVSGKKAMGYEIIPLTLLLRWGDKAHEAEYRAKAIYEALVAGQTEIDGRKAVWQAVYSWPTALGTDGEGVYEYAIDFDLYIERGIE